jgi:hypothetical protein
VAFQLRTVFPFPEFCTLPLGEVPAAIPKLYVTREFRPPQQFSCGQGAFGAGFVALLTPDRMTLRVR